MVRQLTVQQLRDRLTQPDAAPPVILDVREPWELHICALENSRHIPMGQIPARLPELDSQAEIVVVCHHGIRSLQVAHFLAQHGFTSVYNLRGGVDAWAREIDPHMSKY